MIAPGSSQALRIFVVAGEESGDRLGAALMRAVKQRQHDVSFAGVGGTEMAREGLVSPFPISDLAIMGFNAVARKLPLIFRRIRQTAAAVVADKPDVLVIIDSPDFTHRVARRVRKAAPSIPVVDYVSPSVWAWRPGRARSMRRYVDHVMALLPFEPEVHRRLGGPPCSYVGHPLVETAPLLRPNEAEAARRRADPPLLLVLPGSRTSEVKRLLGVFAKTVESLRRSLGPLEVVIPTVPHLEPTLRKETGGWEQPPRIVSDPEEKQAAFRAARAALAKSGTVTLELAVAGVPMVTAYKVTAFEAPILRRLIKAPSAILANLVLGENVVPEFMQEDCTVENLATALLPLLSDGPERQRQLDAFARLDALMEIGVAHPSARAAEIVLRESRGPAYQAGR
jgi:lipid-A-disaccharide synthase